VGKKPISENPENGNIRVKKAVNVFDKTVPT
jgi:hypothetical protein